MKSILENQNSIYYGKVENLTSRQSHFKSESGYPLLAKTDESKFKTVVKLNSKYPMKGKLFTENYISMGKATLQVFLDFR